MTAHRFVSAWMCLALVACNPNTDQSTKEQQTDARIASLEQQVRALQAEVKSVNERFDTIDRELQELANGLEKFLAAGASPPQVDGDNDPGDSEVNTSASVESAVPVPHTFKYLSVFLTSFRLLQDGSLEARLRFANTDKTRGVAIAHRAERSDGIADSGKSFPRAIGGLTDDMGATYRLAEGSAIWFARDQNDWLILDPEASEEKVFRFRPSTGKATGTRYSLTLDLRVATRSDQNRDVSTTTVLFTGVKPR